MHFPIGSPPHRHQEGKEHHPVQYPEKPSIPMHSPKVDIASLRKCADYDFAGVVDELEGSSWISASFVRNSRLLADCHGCRISSQRSSVCAKLTTLCSYGYRSGDVDLSVLVYLFEQRRSRRVQSLGRARVSTLAQKNRGAVVKVESSLKEAGG